MSLRNADIRFEAVEANGRRLSVVLPQAYNRCWVTSLCTAIGPMARQEIDREMTMPSSAVAKALSAFFEGLARMLRVDAVVFPQHHLLTTSLYNDGEISDIMACGGALAARYPDRAMVIRSVNACDHEASIDGRAWPLRMVWIIDDVARDCLPRRDFKRDIAVLARLKLKRQIYGGAISEETLTVCLNLYRTLYLSTYSMFNPDYEAFYVRSLLEAGVLKILTLEDDAGQVEAFCALHACDDTLSVPLLGYNRQRPKADGLYRAIMVLAIQDARQRGLRLNLSAGASSFKRNRGAKPYMEYLLIVDRHLPYLRRWGYWVIGRILRVVAPTLERTAA